MPDVLLVGRSDVDVKAASSLSRARNTTSNYRQGSKPWTVLSAPGHMADVAGNEEAPDSDLGGSVEGLESNPHEGDRTNMSNLAPAKDIVTDLSNVWIYTEYEPDTEDTNLAGNGYAARSFDGPDVEIRDGIQLSASVIETVEPGKPVDTDLYLESLLLDPNRLLDLSLNPHIALHKSGHAGEQFPAQQEPDAEYVLRIRDIAGEYGTAAIVNAHRCLESDGTQHREVEIAVRVDGVEHDSLLDVNQARQFAEGLLQAIAAHEADAARQQKDEPS